MPVHRKTRLRGKPAQDPKDRQLEALLRRASHFLKISQPYSVVGAGRKTQGKVA